MPIKLDQIEGETKQATSNHLFDEKHAPWPVVSWNMYKDESIILLTLLRMNSSRVLCNLFVFFSSSPH